MFTFNELIEDFKNKMKLKRETFSATLEKNPPQIESAPTTLKPNPTSALTIYRSETSCCFSTLKDLFGVSPSTIFFNKTCRAVVANI